MVAKNQPTLFDMQSGEPTRQDYYDPSVTAGRREKSKGMDNRDEVYRDTTPRHLPDRERVLIYIRTMGQRGATRDEISHVLNMPLATVCGRVRELVKEQRVVETDERRQTQRGSAAVVLRWAYTR